MADICLYAHFNPFKPVKISLVTRGRKSRDVNAAGRRTERLSNNTAVIITPRHRCSWIKSLPISNPTSKEWRMGREVRPPDNKIIQRQLNSGPSREESPSIPIPFHPHLSIVVWLSPKPQQGSFHSHYSDWGRDKTVANHQSQPGARRSGLSQLHHVSDVLPASSQTELHSTLHKEVLKYIFAAVAMVLHLTDLQVCALNMARAPYLYSMIHSRRQGVAGYSTRTLHVVTVAEASATRAFECIWRNNAWGVQGHRGTVGHHRFKMF